MSRSVCQRKIIAELARDHQVEHLDDVLLGIKCVSLVDINIDGFSSAKLYQQRLHVVMKFREIRVVKVHTSVKIRWLGFFLRILGWNWGKWKKLQRSEQAHFLVSRLRSTVNLLTG